MSFADTQLSLSCSAALTTDGSLRCVPTASAYAYPDAACTRPYVTTISACEPHEGPPFARLERDACQVSVHVVARELESLATPFAQSGSKCIQLSNGPASGRALKDAVEPSLFAPISEVVE
ncbi:MAG: hypothetical protein RLZZ450_6838 [Pseudomonadota bacterium]